MSTIIQLKRSTTPSSIPNLGELQLGELAINLSKGDIFFEATGSNQGVHSIFTTTPNTGSLIISGAMSLKGDATFVSEANDITFTITNEGYINLGDVAALPSGVTSGSIAHYSGSIYIYI